MPSEHLILLTALRPGLVRNCPLVSPGRPHDRWRLIEGVAFVQRPGTTSYRQVPAPALPSNLSLDCADDDVGTILDPIIDAEIAKNGEARWPEVSAILDQFEISPQSIPAARVRVARLLLCAP